MFDELLYLEGGGNYMSFVMTDGRKVLSRLTMTEALALLPTESFARVHRSYIINKSKVDKIERHQLHLGGQIVPVGSAFDADMILK